MRHLRKFNEAKEEETDQDIIDILESLTEVSDRLGKPNAETFKMGSETGYVVKYDIPISTFGEMTTDAFFDAIDTLHSIKEDILQTEDRFADRFQTTVSQSAGKIKVRFTPTAEQSDGYKFLRLNGREIAISESELRRWAVANKMTITSIEHDDDEGAEMTSVEITFSAPPAGLASLITLEREHIREEEGELDREFEVSSAGNTLYVTPLEEKTYAFVE